MKKFQSFSIITRILIIATIACVFYGYMCRLIGIYFFWESKTIGWTLFWVAIISVLLERIKYHKLHQKKAILEKIGIGLCIFITLIRGLLFFATKQTMAFESAMKFIKTDQTIQNKVGNVNEVFLMPFGGMSMTKGSQGTAGQADLHFVVKGNKKYIDLNCLMSKEYETDWQIEIKE